MPTTMHDHIEALRARVRPGSNPTPDFSDLMSTFLDLAERDDFRQHNRRAQDPLLESAVEATTSRFLGVKPSVALFTLARWGDSDLVHGAFMTRTHHMGVVFWFERDLFGLVSLTPADLRGCDYFRIAGKLMPAGATPTGATPVAP